MSIDLSRGIAKPTQSLEIFWLRMRTDRRLTYIWPDPLKSVRLTENPSRPRQWAKEDRNR